MLKIMSLRCRVDLLVDFLRHKFFSVDAFRVSSNPRTFVNLIAENLKFIRNTSIIEPSIKSSKRGLSERRCLRVLSTEATIVERIESW